MEESVKIEAKDFNAYYGKKNALKNVNLKIYSNKITAIIGPSGCGKSTFLRSLNRMNDLIENFSVNGELLIDKENIYKKDVDVIYLRKKVGMVFQKPNPFPKSIFENIAYGLKIHKLYRDNDELHQKIENSLKEAALWDEVKEDLNKNAFDLSGGQQQRLCIARALVIQPEIILMDEPTASLDPISTAKIEELIRKLKKQYTIVIVTHNMQQAARVSDYSIFFMQGEMVEYDVTSKIFTTPSNKITEEYITGRFG
ncbi:MAG TPA: phosphate ABC transporter ATP-binding protein PstB [Candidatus Goldiibacteriota bacterium]|nr:phosphate ABC transporter ATP-binding protein PstB [Candidatus Goldiibacteriota bacterium]